MRLQEGAELNQVILNEDVFLTKLGLSLLEVFFLLAELFLLVFEGLLHFIHCAPFLEEASCR